MAFIHYNPYQYLKNHYGNFNNVYRHKYLGEIYIHTRMPYNQSSSFDIEMRLSSNPCKYLAINIYPNNELYFEYYELNNFIPRHSLSYFELMIRLKKLLYPKIYTKVEKMIYNVLHKLEKSKMNTWY